MEERCMEPAHHLRVVAGLLALGLALPPTSGDAATRERDVLARAGARVLRYQAELPHLIAIETSVQHAIEPRGGVAEVLVRHLIAELGWIAAPGPDLIGVRDVTVVDGQALRNGERSRLQWLLHGSGDTPLDHMTELLDEGARYNLAEGSRNFNLPTVALFFLHPETQARFKWSRKSPAAAATWQFEFKERGRPTIIHAGDGASVVSRGVVEIEPATGEVLMTELTVHIDKLDYTLVTRFGRVPSMEMQLPVSLEERYVTPSGTITGVATYDNYRRFETSARILQ
jgi:hypothetical protein